MALFGPAIVLVSPFRAWMVDRHGPRRALPPMAAGFAAVLIAIAVIPLRSGANDAAIAMLPGGRCQRASARRGDADALEHAHQDPSVLQTAYSLDGVAEELLYVAGPLIAGVIPVVATPAVGLLASAGLVAAGTGLFLRSPALRNSPAPVAAPRKSTQDRQLGNGREPYGPRAGVRHGAIGLCLSGLGLVIVAFCQARHELAAVAWTEAALWPAARWAASVTARWPGGSPRSAASLC